MKTKDSLSIIFLSIALSGNIVEASDYRDFLLQPSPTLVSLHPLWGYDQTKNGSPGAVGHIDHGFPPERYFAHVHGGEGIDRFKSTVLLQVRNQLSNVTDYSASAVIIKSDRAKEEHNEFCILTTASFVEKNINPNDDDLEDVVRTDGFVVSPITLQYQRALDNLGSKDMSNYYNAYTTNNNVVLRVVKSIREGNSTDIALLKVKESNLPIGNYTVTELPVDIDPVSGIIPSNGWHMNYHRTGLPQATYSFHPSNVAITDNTENNIVLDDPYVPYKNKNLKGLYGAALISDLSGSSVVNGIFQHLDNDYNLNIFTHPSHLRDEIIQNCYDGTKPENQTVKETSILRNTLYALSKREMSGFLTHINMRGNRDSVANIVSGDFTIGDGSGKKFAVLSSNYSYLLNAAMEAAQDSIGSEFYIYEVNSFAPDTYNAYDSLKWLDDQDSYEGNYHVSKDVYQRALDLQLYLQEDHLQSDEIKGYTPIVNYRGHVQVMDFVKNPDYVEPNYPPSYNKVYRYLPHDHINNIVIWNKVGSLNSYSEIVPPLVNEAQYIYPRSEL